jgi:hypothetical protein
MRKAEAKRDTRCWPGCEPVKGKKEHSQGSCRLKAESKLTVGTEVQSETETATGPVGGCASAYEAVGGAASWAAELANKSQEAG